MKKILSLLLVTVLVFSVFVVVPFSASAVEADIDTTEILSGDYFYEVISSTSAKITDYFGDDTKLIIPSIIDGYIVTEIQGYTFYSHDDLVSVYIPDSVNTIETSAFVWCDNLTELYISESVTDIGEDVVFGNSNPTIYGYEGTTAQEYAKSNGYAFACVNNIEWDPYYFSYTVLDDDTAEITDYYGKETILNIPSEVDGYTVSSIGKTSFRGCNDLAWVNIPDTVKNIGDRAFNNCQNLSLVKIPDSVKSVDSLAFYGCKNLASINIPPSIDSIGERAFGFCYDSDLKDYVQTPNFKIYGYNNTAASEYAKEHGFRFFTFGELQVDPKDFTYEKLKGSAIKITKYSGYMKNLVIPKTLDGYTVSAIGEGAFTGCESLESITIPSTVTDIDVALFRSCDKLTTIKVDADNKRYDSRENCNAIIETATNTLVAGCSNTQIPLSVTSIGESAFDRIRKFDSFVIPDSVVSIGDGAFQYTNFTEVSLPDSVKEIGDYAFYGCHILETVNISAFVESIGLGAFSECPQIKSITVDSKNKYYDSRNKCNAIIETSTNTLINGCMNSVVPATVVSIAEIAFFDCYNLTSITIPDTVKIIGEAAFAYCYELTIYGYKDSEAEYYAKKEGIEFVPMENPIFVSGDYEYEVMSNNTAKIRAYLGDAKSLTIPSTLDGITVTEIGMRAFSRRYNLTSIVIPDTIVSIRLGAFHNCKNIASITVDSKNKYYDSRDNCNAIIASATDSLVFGCKNTVIPSSVTKILDYAFDGCESLTTYKIPKQITKIGRMAFVNCDRLEDVTIPATVTDIGDYAFGCLYYYEERYGEVIAISVDFTVYGYNDTAAEVYAKENDFKFKSLGDRPVEPEYELGDVDGDGKVSIMDATEIQQHLAELIVVDDDRLACGDTDRDGKVTIMDATQIQQFLAELIPEL